MTHILTGRRDRLAILRQKAEEVYIAIDTFEVAWGSFATILSGVVRGAYDYNQMFDMQKEYHDKQEASLGRKVPMLVEIYFPEALPELKSLLDVRDRFSKLSSIHKEAYKDGALDEFDWARDFSPLVTEFADRSRRCKAKIVSAARKLTLNHSR